jgi:hypothetical protein
VPLHTVSLFYTIYIRKTRAVCRVVNKTTIRAVQVHDKFRFTCIINLVWDSSVQGLGKHSEVWMVVRAVSSFGHGVLLHYCYGCKCKPSGISWKLLQDLGSIGKHRRLCKYFVVPFPDSSCTTMIAATKASRIRSFFGWELLLKPQSPLYAIAV